MCFVGAFVGLGWVRNVFDGNDGDDDDHEVDMG